jgi:hypothetical protein
MAWKYTGAILTRVWRCSVWSGWPDWVNFRLLGDCLHYAVFGKLQNKPNEFRLLCQGQSNVFILTKNCLGHILGDLFSQAPLVTLGVIHPKSQTMTINLDYTFRRWNQRRSRKQKQKQKKWRENFFNGGKVSIPMKFGLGSSSHLRHLLSVLTVLPIKRCCHYTDSK